MGRVIDSTHWRAVRLKHEQARVEQSLENSAKMGQS